MGGSQDTIFRCSPASNARTVAARMAAFIPGESPPLVRIAIVFDTCPPSRDRLSHVTRALAKTQKKSAPAEAGTHGPR